MDKAELMAAYLEHLGVQVHGGHGWRKVRCPFHDDRSPSATVSGDGGAFKCHVCDVKGDVFSLVMANEGVDFIGAKQFIETELGLAVEPTHHDGGRPGVPGKPRSKRVKRAYVPPGHRAWGSLG